MTITITTMTCIIVVVVRVAVESMSMPRLVPRTCREATVTVERLYRRLGEAETVDDEVIIVHGVIARRYACQYNSEITASRDASLTTYV